MEQPLQGFFMENRGQWDPRARFVGREPGLNYWVTESGLRLDFHRVGLDPNGGGLVLQGQVVAMSFLNANPHPASNAYAEAKMRVDFFVGDVTQHRQGVRSFQEAYLENIYPGVHLRNYYFGGKARYDIIVSPGADPGQIAFQVDGANGLGVDKDGSLVLETTLGPIKNSGLTVYQPVGNERRMVPAAFRVEGNTVRFELGQYDSRLPLVIDPLVYGTYVGSDFVPGFPVPYSTGFENVSGIAADPQGNLYITGLTTSITYPISAGAYQATFSGTQDCFLVRMDGDAYAVSYASYFGGSAADNGLGIGIDESTGQLWIGGTTTSTNLPAGSFAATTKGTNMRFFLARFNVNPDESVSFFGSRYYNDPGEVIAATAVWGDFAVSQSGNVFLAGASTNAALVAGGFVPYLAGAGGGRDGFVAGFTPAGGQLYESLVGGSGNESMGRIDVNDQDQVACTGLVTFVGSLLTDLTTAAFRTTDGVYTGGRVLQNNDFYLVKLGNTGTVGVAGFSALVGGSSQELGPGLMPTEFQRAGGDNSNVSPLNPLQFGAAVAYDPAGNIYITGRTTSFDFPRTPGAYDQFFTSSAKVFVTKLAPDASRIIYSTGLNTTGPVLPASIDVDQRGVASVGGVVGFFYPGGPPPQMTIQGTIPVVDPIQGEYVGGDELVAPPNNNPTAPPDTGWFPSTVDGFVTVVNQSGSSLLFSDYVGGEGNDFVNKVFTDAIGATWLAGQTFPVFNLDGGQKGTGLGPWITTNAFKGAADVASDGFAIKLRVGLPILTSVTLSPGSVAGGLGATSTATVSLADPAPAGGVTITLTLSNTTATSFTPNLGDTTTVVTVLEGNTSVTQTVFTFPVPGQVTSDLRATLDNDFKVARLTINPWLDDFSLSPATTVGGNNVTARVRLFQLAPQPVIVTLATTRPDLVTLPDPAQIIVPAGANTATVSLPTRGVELEAGANPTAVVSAGLLGVGRDSILTLTPAALTSITFQPARIDEGSDTTATILLNGLTGNPRIVTITQVSGAPGSFVNGNPLPATVTIPAQTRSLNVTVSAPNVATDTFATLRASDGTTSAQGTYIIDQIDIANLTFTPDPTGGISGGTVLTGRVRLSKAAGASGFSVQLAQTGDLTAGTLSTHSVMIPPGAQESPPFTFTSNIFTGANRVTTLSAQRTGFTTRSVVVTVFGLSASMTITPNVVTGGLQNSTGRITLNRPAGAQGLLFTLSSNNPGAASVPPTVRVPAGASSVTFPITTSKVVGTVTVRITAAASATVRTFADIQVRTPRLLSLTINPETVTGPDSATGTVIMETTAPAGGVVVNLTATPDTATSIPVSVTIPAGRDRVNFTIRTRTLTSDVLVTVRASVGVSSVTDTLLVRAPNVQSLTFNPSRVNGGKQSVGTITLDRAAPVGGLTVQVVSGDPARASVIGSTTITIPAGARTATFRVQTQRVSREVAVRFTASTPGGDVASGFLFVIP